MVSDLVTTSVEQHCHKVPSERAEPAEILYRLYAQYGEETLSYVTVYEWGSKSSEGC
jgi:hypothetical protein